MTEKNEKFDEFLEEVQNDIRQEKYLQLWKKYGTYVTGGVTAIIAAVALYTFWQNYSHKKQMQLSDQFLTAQNFIYQGKFEEAEAVLNNLSAGDTKAYGYMRDLQKAALNLASNNSEKHQQAVTAYEQLMKNTKLPEYVRDIARMMLAKVMIVQGKPVEEVQTTLDPLLKEGQAWRFFALELMSQYHFKLGNKEKALEGFAEIARSQNVPEGIMLRAQLMVQVANQSKPKA